MQTDSIKIIETFISIQGEGANIGRPYYFIRTAGCPLRCNFCDTEYSWKASQYPTVTVASVIDQAISQCHQHGIDWVSITGGEPLLYPEQLKAMMSAFRKARLYTHIETSGRYHDKYVHGMSDIYSVDAKTPCTGETMDGYFSGLKEIRPCDQVKCLIYNDDDLNYANELNKILDGKCTMVLQPFNVEVFTDHRKNMGAQLRAIAPNQATTLAQQQRGILVAYSWLLNAYHQRLERGELWKNVMLAPQLHVLAYGNKPGK